MFSQILDSAVGSKLFIFTNVESSYVMFHVRNCSNGRAYECLRVPCTVGSHVHRFVAFGNVAVAVGIGDASLFDI
jgi:hypothetical protein